jgi:uncharacterized protein (DUF2236 family)
MGGNCDTSVRTEDMSGAGGRAASTVYYIKSYKSLGPLSLADLLGQFIDRSHDRVRGVVGEGG